MAASGAVAHEENCERHSAENLYIRSAEDLLNFWRAVLPDFVRIVDPNESGLLDLLYTDDMLTDSDLESLSGKEVVTRADQARKLAVHLMHYNWNDFMSRIAPALCDARYAHIIPDKYWIANEDQRAEMTSLRAKHVEPLQQCFRHLIQRRVRPATMADMMFHHHCLSFEDYKTLTVSELRSQGKWDLLFSAFRKPPSSQAAKAMEGDLRTFLSRRRLNFPDKMISESLMNGFCCCCERCLSITGLRHKEAFRRRMKPDPSLSTSWSVPESTTTNSPWSTVKSASDSVSSNSGCQDKFLQAGDSLATAQSDERQRFVSSPGQLLDCSLEGNVALQAASGAVPPLLSEQLLRVPSKQRKPSLLVKLGKRRSYSLFSKLGPVKKPNSVFTVTSVRGISDIISIDQNQGEGDGRSAYTVNETLEVNTADSLAVVETLNQTWPPVERRAVEESQSEAANRLQATNDFSSNRPELHVPTPVVDTGRSSRPFITCSTVNSIQAYATGVPQGNLTDPAHSRLFEYLQWPRGKRFMVGICVLAAICQLITITDRLISLFGGLDHGIRVAVCALGVLASVFQFFSPLLCLVVVLASRPYQTFLAHQIFSLAQVLHTHHSPLRNVGSGHRNNP